MNRRNFLILSATAVSAAAIGGTVTVLDDPYAYIDSLLHEYVGEFTMDDAEERQFVDAFSGHYGSEKVLGFVALHRLRRATPLSTDYTDAKVELYKRRLVSDFMTSTDFFRQYQQGKVPHVYFTGFKVPCSNPFAQRV
ncbi:type 1 periplasmic-binding domain-containing protein [Pseudomonas saliphila]|uniref:hypothetical protein n=1 Tax=Pseudomonas saliphila TaxID=2586906 RepID=UPI00123AE8FC|nr:hypothetical protein [Pseudomonas saliphila]